jgi:hypothetical protein
LERYSAGIEIGLQVIADVSDVPQLRRENPGPYHSETVLTEEPLILLRRTNVMTPFLSTRRKSGACGEISFIGLAS